MAVGCWCCKVALVSLIECVGPCGVGGFVGRGPTASVEEGGIGIVAGVVGARRVVRGDGWG